MNSVRTSPATLPKRKADFIAPMECALVSKLPEGSDWTYEVKLNGYRAIAVKTPGEAILYSRNGKNFSKRYPLIAKAFHKLLADTVIDGEVVVLVTCPPQTGVSSSGLCFIFILNLRIFGVKP